MLPIFCCPLSRSIISATVRLYIYKFLFTRILVTNNNISNRHRLSWCTQISLAQLFHFYFFSNRAHSYRISCELANEKCSTDLLIVGNHLKKNAFYWECWNTCSFLLSYKNSTLTINYDNIGSRLLHFLMQLWAIINLWMRLHCIVLNWIELCKCNSDYKLFIFQIVYVHSSTMRRRIADGHYCRVRSRFEYNRTSDWKMTYLVVNRNGDLIVDDPFNGIWNGHFLDWWIENSY